MRDLAASSSPPITTMTHEQVLAALKGPTGVIDTEYEVRDYSGNLVDRLPKVPLGDDGSPGGVEGVIDAPGAQQLEVNVDQTIPGLLRLQMLPIEDLRHASNAYEIWPYVIHEFDGPGGQRITGRWQMGCYPWQPPHRDIDDVGLEVWSVALPDRASILEDNGPGLAGWSINAGQAWATDILRLVERGGLDPTLCEVPATGETAAKFIKWWYAEDRELKRYEDELNELEGHPEAQPEWLTEKAFNKRPLNERGTYWTTQVRIAWTKNYIGTHEVREGDTSLWQIIGEECAAAGWEAPYFDWSGRLVIRDAVTDLTTVAIEHRYETGPDSIILAGGLSDEVDITQVRNRGFGVSTGRDTVLEPCMVLLEEIDPAHPACESNGRPGAYKDFTRSDDLAGSAAALRAGVATELRDRANASRSLSYSSLLNPAHEPYDFAWMRYEDDPELEDGVTFHTRRLAPDLFDHTCTHQHFRTWSAAL